jgi:predicted PurR-regulated permease PerM
MAAPLSPLRPYRALIMLGGIVLVTATLYWAQKILIPLALAVVLAFVLNPVVAFVQRRGLPRVPSVILIACLSFLFLGGVGFVLTLQMKRLAAELPKYKENVATKVAGLREVGQGRWLQDLEEMLKEPLKADPTAEKTDRGSPEKGSPEEIQAVRMQPASTFPFDRVVAPTAEFLATAGLVVVLVVFMLIQREELRNRLIRLIGQGRLIQTTRAFEEAARGLSRFLLMQLVVNAGFGLTLGLGLFLFGVPYPLLWGILSGTLRFVPYVGTWLATGLMLIFSVAVMPTWTIPLLVLAFVVVLELSTAFFVEPLLFGHSTGVSPIALVVAAAFWTWLWGPIGLVLSTPLTACLVVLGRYVPRLEFLGVLLGAKSVMDPEFTYYQRLLARDQDEATDVVNAYLRVRPPERVYDEVLVPALVLAKLDRDSGELSPDDERFIFQVTKAILDDLEFVPPIPAGSVEANSEVSAEPPGQKILVLACPACDEADELALKMLRRLLDPDRFQTEVLSGEDARADGHFANLGEIPAVVCVAALPPGGLVQARYLCKRLRASFPHQKIVVVRWGLPDNAGPRKEELLAAGADVVATTLLEARTQFGPLASSLAHGHDQNGAVQPVEAQRIPQDARGGCGTEDELASCVSRSET